jgi:hypothetical protein
MLNVGGIPDQVQVQPPYGHTSMPGVCPEFLLEKYLVLFCLGT